MSNHAMPDDARAETTDRVLRERAHFDRLADELGNVWWGHKTYAGQARLDYRRELVEQWTGVGPGKLVLEPGAGSGEFTTRLSLTGAHVVAVELSPKQARLGLSRMHDRRNVDFVVGDVNRLPCPDHSFDAIIGCSVLHHFQLSGALPEFARILRPGGCLMFSEPNMLNPQIAIEKNIPFIGSRLGNSPDETAFFRWQIAKILKRHRFDEVRVEPFDFLHPGTPEKWTSCVFRLSKFLERVPIVREFAGSLLIYAVMPK